ncbi:hypothetical protein [Caballeronia ptereochthonis]|uniref:Uncharacterized protein n=1 Tax=Caballeronia ptereochthonis TaxID=1777144 RepID=A0A158APU5_9BURK|nr:hypothetical protein [Caballeronia ptereochthonis]SAK59536.1 hypothetical protein AWB83_02124 [Caballeronia ptereochthonis]
MRRQGDPSSLLWATPYLFAAWTSAEFVLTRPRGRVAVMSPFVGASSFGDISRTGAAAKEAA